MEKKTKLFIYKLSNISVLLAFVADTTDTMETILFDGFSVKEKCG